MTRRHFGTSSKSSSRAKIQITLLLLSPFMAACADQPFHSHHGIHGQVVHLPNGSYGYLIQCGASATSNCSIDAGKDCMEVGYTVIDKHEPGPWFAFGNPLFVALSEPKASLTIRCNTADGLYPDDEEEGKRKAQLVVVLPPTTPPPPPLSQAGVARPEVTGGQPGHFTIDLPSEAPRGK